MSVSAASHRSYKSSNSSASGPSGISFDTASHVTSHRSHRGGSGTSPTPSTQSNYPPPSSSHQQDHKQNQPQSFDNYSGHYRQKQFNPQHHNEDLFRDIDSHNGMQEPSQGHRPIKRDEDVASYVNGTPPSSHFESQQSLVIAGTPQSQAVSEYQFDFGPPQNQTSENEQSQYDDFSSSQHSDKKTRYV